MTGSTSSDGDYQREDAVDTRKELRDDLSSAAIVSRELLPDGFIVGGEIVDGFDGLEAKLSIQPPVGHIVTAQFSSDIDYDTTTVAHDIVANAVREAKRASGDDLPPAS